MSFLGSKPVAAYALAGGMDPETLIISHSPIVRKIAWHILSRSGHGTELADLVQIGMSALIDAARKFEDRGIPFAGYAATRIRGSMIDALREAATSTRSEMARQRMLRNARQGLVSQLGREPTVIELAEAMNLPASSVHDILDDIQRSSTTSISDFYDDNDLCFADTSADPEECAVEKSRQAMISKEIAKLPDREQQILQMFFFEEMNLDEIGLCLGVSAARICQIKKSAMDKLRARLGDNLSDIL